MKTKTLLFLLLGFSAIFLVSCLAGPNALTDIPSPEDAKVAGFWAGLWHGFVSPFAFIISLFVDKISVYEVYNTGGWYDFGFVLGASIIFGGSSKASCRKR